MEPLNSCFIISFIVNIVLLITIPTFKKSLEVFSLYLWFPVDNGFIIVACISYLYIVKRVQRKRFKPRNLALSIAKEREFTTSSVISSQTEQVKHVQGGSENDERKVFKKTEVSSQTEQIQGGSANDEQKVFKKSMEP